MADRRPLRSVGAARGRRHLRGEGHRPSFILRSYLVRGGEPEVWRIMTEFRTAEDLAAMRASGETPRGVLIFHAAGAEPSFTPFEVIDGFA